MAALVPPQPQQLGFRAHVLPLRQHTKQLARIVASRAQQIPQAMFAVGLVHVQPTLPLPPPSALAVPVLSLLPAFTWERLATSHARMMQMATFVRPTAFAHFRTTTLFAHAVRALPDRIALFRALTVPDMASALTTQTWAQPVCAAIRMVDHIAILLVVPWHPGAILRATDPRTVFAFKMPMERQHAHAKLLSLDPTAT
jgi:hypothetical protein